MKSMKKPFKINRSMELYFEKILKRDHISVLKKEEKGDEILYELPVSGNRFRVLLKDAYCERESEKYGGIPVYSLETVLNPGKLEYLMKCNNSNGFIVLSTDQERYKKLIVGK